jgi:hypothetical protein
MNGLNIYLQQHWLVAYYVFAAIAAVPTLRIFMRAGFPAWQAVVLLVPMAGVIGAAGLLALRPWPRAKAEAL